LAGGTGARSSLTASGSTSRGTRPPLWRRLELASDLFLDQVHEIIQVAFGWTDSHLHQFGSWPGHYDPETEHYLCPFQVDEGEVGVPEEDVRLDEVLAMPVTGCFTTTTLVTTGSTSSNSRRCCPGAAPGRARRVSLAAVTARLRNRQRTARPSPARPCAAGPKADPPRRQAPGGSSRFLPVRSGSAADYATSCQPHPAARAGGPPGGSTGPDPAGNQRRHEPAALRLPRPAPTRAVKGMRAARMDGSNASPGAAGMPGPLLWPESGSGGPRPGSSIGPGVTRHSAPASLGHSSSHAVAAERSRKQSCSRVR